jgi:hypothetical protein
VVPSSSSAVAICAAVLFEDDRCFDQLSSPWS